MWIVDFPTLVIIIAAGMLLGVQGFSGFDAARVLFGEHTSLVFIAVGLSALWQLTRQRFQ